MDVNNTAIFRSSLRDVYHEIKPYLKECEQIRLKSLLNFLITVFAILLVGILILGHIFQYFGAFDYTAFLLIYIMIFALLYNFYAKSFSNKVKNQLKDKFSEIFNFNYEKEISNTFLKNYIKRETCIYDDDIFAGIYNNVQYIVFEEPYRIRLVFKTNKKIKSKTQIISKKLDSEERFRILTTSIITLPIFIFYLFSVLHAQNYQDPKLDFGFICSFLLYGFLAFKLCLPNSKKRNKSYNKIITESSELQKQFEIIGDQVEGRYALTTAFINRLNNLQNSFKSNKIICTFVDDIVKFEISKNKDMFEFANLFIKADSPKCIEIFYNEITSIFNLIEYFKFDENTGL